LDKWSNFIVLFCIGLTSKFDTIPLLHPLQWFIFGIREASAVKLVDLATKCNISEVTELEANGKCVGG
jgi:hypothetical protein